MRFVDQRSPSPSALNSLDAAWIRREQAQVRVEKVRLELASAQAAVAEARRAELAERARQPVSVAEAIALALRAGVVGLILGGALAGEPEPTRRRSRR